MPCLHELKILRVRSNNNIFSLSSRMHSKFTIPKLVSLPNIFDGNTISIVIRHRQILRKLLCVNQNSIIFQTVHQF